MFNCWYVIVIALSICHEVNTEEKFTRACTASQGRCAKTKDSNCESSFGSGWTEKGRCCRKRPCCVFQCEDIPPNNLINGAVTVTERTIGSTANFTCDAGHSLVGNETITCSSSGWNGDIPQCRFQCEDIPTDRFANGTVIVAERNVGSTAKFTCDAGLFLVGRENITCTTSGWDGNIPQCVQCEDIPTNRFANGTVIVAERNVGSTAKFTCDAGLFLVGRENITCTTSGWDGNIPQCAKILCPETVAFFRGSKYIFTCNLATWSNSKANCNVHGGHLTSVETGDENAFLVDVVALMHKHIQQILYAFFWIGLTDNNDEMSYKWLSGEPLNYSDWYQGSPQQPDNKNMQNKQGAHCAMIHPFYSLKWGDEFCSVLAYSVCEIRLREPYALSEDNTLFANLEARYELYEDDMLFAFLIKY